MVNKNNIPDYFLFFAISSLDGLEAMKNAMCKVDPTGEFQFSDFADASKQLVLFQAEPDYQWLRQILSDHFRRTKIEIRDLGDWVVEDTPFLRTHLKTQVLIPMEKDGVVCVADAKPGHRPYTYPDGTVLKFL